MKSKVFRTNPELLRNSFSVTEDCGMPIIKKEWLPPIDALLSFCDICESDERAKCTAYLVHFFKDDYKFDKMYNSPFTLETKSRLKMIAQYTAVCTPDFSIYPEMPDPVQRMQVFRNRWCGACWQDMGLHVIPTISWSSRSSYSFCFNGVPQNSTVAITTVGSYEHKNQFLEGYNQMLEVLHPELIICYGDAFPEMEGNVLVYPYQAFRKKEEAV